MPTKPAQDPQHQCQEVTSDGRRCRMSRMKGHASLCFLHAQRQQQVPDPKRVAAELLGPFHDLKTANAVNHALGTLFLMVAQNRIPPRNAAVLAHLGQLLLQTLRPVQSEISGAWGYERWDNALRRILFSASQTQAPGQLTQTAIAASLPPQRPQKEEDEADEAEDDQDEEDEDDVQDDEEEDDQDEEDEEVDEEEDEAQDDDEESDQEEEEQEEEAQDDEGEQDDVPAPSRQRAPAAQRVGGKSSGARSSSPRSREGPKAG